MKKKIGKFILTVVVLLLTFTAGVSANEAYHKWAGTEEYQSAKENIGLFETAYNNLFKTKEDLVADKSALEKEKSSLKTKLEEAESALETANNNNATIAEERDKFKSDLDVANQKLANVDLIYSNVKTQLSNLITDVNKSNGKGNRYDTLAGKINELAGYVGVGERIDGNVGNGAKSNELKQAEEDMTDLEKETERVLEEIKDKQ